MRFFEIINETRVKGKPLSDDPRYNGSKYVIIYRARLADENPSFENMDYITLNRQWAKQHADHVAAIEEEPAVVIKAMVPIETVYEAYNPGEYFYDGKTTVGKVIYKA